MTNKINNMEDERDLITLIDDDGKEVECEFVDTVEYGGKLFCIVEPLMEDEDLEEGSCYIFNMIENDDDSVDLTPVESDEELEAVFAKFLENCADEDEEDDSDEVEDACVCGEGCNCSDGECTKK